MRNVAPFAIRISRKRWKIRSPGIEGGSIGFEDPGAGDRLQGLQHVRGSPETEDCGKADLLLPGHLAADRLTESRPEGFLIHQPGKGDRGETLQAVAGEGEIHTAALQVERNRIALKVLENP